MVANVSDFENNQSQNSGLEMEQKFIVVQWLKTSVKYRTVWLLKLAWMTNKKVPLVLFITFPTILLIFWMDNAAIALGTFCTNLLALCSTIPRSFNKAWKFSASAARFSFKLSTNLVGTGLKYTWTSSWNWGKRSWCGFNFFGDANCFFFRRRRVSILRFAIFSEDYSTQKLPGD